MHIALLVITWNRTTEVFRLLESLQKQQYTDFSIYLADQNPPGYLDTVLDAFAGLPLHRIVCEANGVSFARNTLLRALPDNADLVAFPDDDCAYEPDTLLEAVRCFQNHPQHGAGLGIWKPFDAPRPRPEDQRLTSVSRFTAFHKGETYVQFYRRETIRAVGFFDENMGPRPQFPSHCGEDTDYLLRALELPVTALRTEAICVRHPAALQRRTGKTLLYGQSRMELLRKHHAPLWFCYANVVYPLVALPLDLARQTLTLLRYRWAMFRGRLRGLHTKP